jgi:hypothetical protein
MARHTVTGKSVVVRRIRSPLQSAVIPRGRDLFNRLWMRASLFAVDRVVPSAALAVGRASERGEAEDSLPLETPRCSAAEARVTRLGTR